MPTGQGDNEAPDRGQTCDQARAKKISSFFNKSGLFFLIKKLNHIAQLQKWLFSAPYSSLPTTAFGHILAKNYHIEAAHMPNWASGLNAQYCCMPLIISSICQSAVLPLTQLVLFYKMPSSPSSVMSMV
jgi:hypothetical protein